MFQCDCSTLKDMNAVLKFLYQNRQRFALEEYGNSKNLTYIVATPRFRASNHVVFILLSEDASRPVFVVKVPRLVGSTASIEKEAMNLRAIQEGRKGGFNSVPDVIAFEQYIDRPILVQTAIQGQLMDPSMVRRDPGYCSNKVVEWLNEFHRSTLSGGMTDMGWYGRLVETPINKFMQIFPFSGDEKQLIEQTSEIVAPLKHTDLPLVFEHGDLSHPNLLVEGGELGVVDWELAEPKGLPACDLFFFLTYAAFSITRAQSKKNYLKSFNSAFFGEQAWARHYVSVYAEQIGLPDSMLTPLFILCWARYLANLLTRIDGSRTDQRSLEPDTANWLRTNRFYHLWRYSLAHIHDLKWHELH
jgi:aminoglycoside phosphotransferase (APT) family kinase protein